MQENERISIFIVLSKLEFVLNDTHFFFFLEMLGIVSFFFFFQEYFKTVFKEKQSEPSTSSQRSLSMFKLYHVVATLTP